MRAKAAETRCELLKENIAVIQTEMLRIQQEANLGYKSQIELQEKLALAQRNLTAERDAVEEAKQRIASIKHTTEEQVQLETELNQLRENKAWYDAELSRLQLKAVADTANMKERATELTRELEAARHNLQDASEQIQAMKGEVQKLTAERTSEREKRLEAEVLLKRATENQRAENIRVKESENRVETLKERVDELETMLKETEKERGTEKYHQSKLQGLQAESYELNAKQERERLQESVGKELKAQADENREKEKVIESLKWQIKKGLEKDKEANEKLNQEITMLRKRLLELEETQIGNDEEKLRVQLKEAQEKIKLQVGYGVNHFAFGISMAFLD